MISTTTIIVIFLGVSFAAIYTYFIKKVPGDLIRKLAEKNAEDEKTACSLEELNFGKFYSCLVKLSFGKNSSLRRFVACVYPEYDQNGEKIPDIPEQKYFLLPDKKETALYRYNNKDTSLSSVIVCIVILAVAAAVAIFVAPWFTNVVQNAYGFDSEITDSASDYDSNTAPDSEEMSDNTENTENTTGVKDNKPNTRYETVE